MYGVKNLVSTTTTTTITITINIINTTTRKPPHGNRNQTNIVDQVGQVDQVDQVGQVDQVTRKQAAKRIKVTRSNHMYEENASKRPR